jgi:hypothetical protein
MSSKCIEGGIRVRVRRTAGKIGITAVAGHPVVGLILDGLEGFLATRGVGGHGSRGEDSLDDLAGLLLVAGVIGGEETCAGGAGGERGGGGEHAAEGELAAGDLGLGLLWGSSSKDDCAAGLEGSRTGAGPRAAAIAGRMMGGRGGTVSGNARAASIEKNLEIYRIRAMVLTHQSCAENGEMVVAILLFLSRRYR